jgi:hypothetical protein
MASGKKIDLHEIDSAIKTVQASLRAEKASVSSVDAKKIDATIKKLEKLRKSNSLLCPRSWAVFPPDASTPKRAKKKPA